MGPRHFHETVELEAWLRAVRLSSVSPERSGLFGGLVPGSGAGYFAGMASRIIETARTPRPGALAMRARRAARFARFPRGWLLFWAVLVPLFPAALQAGRAPWTTSRIIGSPNPPPPYRVQPAFPKLTFAHPVDAGALPRSDRILVLEQGGKLWSFPAGPDISRADLVFDFSAFHQPFDSAYSFAFHPRFAENRFVFVCYVEPGGRANGSHVSRFTLQPNNPPTIDPKSEKVVLRWVSGGHNGGKVAFGNDGFLYVSTGDGATPDPPDFAFKTGQDVSDLLSSILRIDVDHTGGGNSYSIPRDNPFLNFPGARPEVYAFGLRNPWRISFDRATGDLWAGDVGWEQWEMIDLVKPSGNYGWSIVEGPNTHVRTDVQQGPGPILPPMIALPHSEAASITGGLVYHGAKLPKLRGAYVYGDWETGKFWGLRHDGDRLLSNDELCAAALKPVSFTEDRDGEILIVDYNGGLYQFVPETAPPANTAFPRRLSETGLFQNITSLDPAPGVFPYRVNAALWSDSADAGRLLAIPGSAVVVTENGRQTIAGPTWDFPVNTVLVRTLTLETKRGDPASRRRVETQLLHFTGQGWNPYTFRWNEAQTDAELAPKEGANDTFIVADPAAPGGRREIPWRFASRAECLRCHNAWAGETLSFNWRELKTPGPQSELDRLEALGLLRVSNPPKPLSGLANPYDSSQPADDRARAWLQVNCATCHRFGAGGGIAAQFNVELAPAETRALDVKPSRGDFGIAGARVIASGDPCRSTLFYRISTEGAGRMPHIGSRVADEAGIQVVGDWIRSLPSTPNPEPDAIAAAAAAAGRAGWLKAWRNGTDPEASGKLLATTSGALALLDEAAKPRTPAALRDAAGAAGAASPNAVVRDLFQRLLPAGRRRATLGTDINPRTILSMSGDAARGKRVFEQEGGAQCSRCHRLGGAGREFGPDLSAIGRKYDRAGILEQILLPSKSIAPGYQTYIITLRDGSELSGFLTRTNAGDTVFRGEDLVERRLTGDEAKGARPSALSAMPEELLAPLTAQEAADLLEYLLRN
jgi:putative heme-binding domain-containing protein